MIKVRRPRRYPLHRGLFRARLRALCAEALRPDTDPLDAECLLTFLLQPALQPGWSLVPRPRRWPGLFNPFKAVSRGP